MLRDPWLDVTEAIEVAAFPRVMCYRTRSASTPGVTVRMVLKDLDKWIDVAYHPRKAYSGKGQAEIYREALAWLDPYLDDGCGPPEIYATAWR